jgi:hypothetical protein
MSTWNFISLAVIGVKKDVSAFNRVALQLPVLSQYVIERNGKPVRSAMFEDMIFEKPWRWCKHWWRSCYHFMIRDVEPAVEMVQDVSKRHLNLCFRLDWNCEHEQYRTHLIRRGRVEYRDFDGGERRLDLLEELTGGAEDYGDEVEWEIDMIVTSEFERQFEKLWHRRTYKILYDQLHRKSKKRGRDTG